MVNLWKRRTLFFTQATEFLRMNVPTFATEHGDMATDEQKRNAGNHALDLYAYLQLIVFCFVSMLHCILISNQLFEYCIISHSSGMFNKSDSTLLELIVAVFLIVSRLMILLRCVTCQALNDLIAASFQCMCCRIVVFSVRVLKDERIVIVAEQRPECTEEQVRASDVFC